MRDPSDEHRTFFDRQTEDQAVRPEPDTIIIFAAVKLPGVKKRVLLQRLQSV